MSRFADFLVERGTISREDIDRATQHQIIYGARLGTNLVELKLINVEHLAEALADFHNVPLPPRNWLERPARAAVKRVSRPMVERIRFIPMRLDGNVLHAAVLDPTDPGALDTLRFALGCRIEPYVLPEIWMHDWLFTLFKIPRGIRHVETDAGPEQEETGATSDRARASQPGAHASFRSQDGPSMPAMPPERSTGQVVRPSGQDRASMPRVQSGRAGEASKPAPDREMTRPLQHPDRGQAMAAAASGRVAAPTSQRKDSPMGYANRPAAGGGDMVLNIDPTDAAPAPGLGASVRPPPVLIKALGQLVGSARHAQVPGPGRVPMPGHMHLHIPAPANVPVIVSDPESEIMWGREGTSDPLPTAELPAADPGGRNPVEAAKPPTFGPGELARLERELADPSDRERMIEIGFAIATQLAQTVALFIVQKGTLQGVRCVQLGAQRLLDGLLISVELPSMLAHAASVMEPIRAPPGARALDMRILHAIGDVSATEVGLFPITIRQRVVNLLYASNGAERLGPIAFEALTILAQQVSAGYERLIITRKGR